MTAYSIGYYDSFEKDGVLMIGKLLHHWQLSIGYYDSFSWLLWQLFMITMTAFHGYYDSFEKIEVLMIGKNFLYSISSSNRELIIKI